MRVTNFRIDVVKHGSIVGKKGRDIYFFMCELNEENKTILPIEMEDLGDFTALRKKMKDYLGPGYFLDTGYAKAQLHRFLEDEITAYKNGGQTKEIKVFDHHGWSHDVKNNWYFYAVSSLQVIPQLIARIDTPRPLVSRLIHQLLADLGKHHPQALVYSLTVACKSNNAARRNAANKILSKIREHSETLVNQSLMVSDELIRVAILWHEQWYEALEEVRIVPCQFRSPPMTFRELKTLFILLKPSSCLQEFRQFATATHPEKKIYQTYFFLYFDCLGLTPLFWRTEYPRNVGEVGASSRHAGARPSDSERNLFSPSLWQRPQRGQTMVF